MYVEKIVSQLKSGSTNGATKKVQFNSILCTGILILTIRRGVMTEITLCRVVAEQEHGAAGNSQSQIHTPQL